MSDPQNQAPATYEKHPSISDEYLSEPHRKQQEPDEPERVENAGSMDSFSIIYKESIHQEHPKNDAASKNSGPSSPVMENPAPILKLDGDREPEDSDWLEDWLDDAFMHPSPSQRSCVAGVSGGPDSMALLALLVHYGYQPIVCHVNYQKRPTADRDEAIVKTFCQAHQLECRVLKPIYQSGNFQGWARDVRMDFFEQTAREAGGVPIFLAHQQDDVIETYFLQKKRNILCDFFGIRKLTVKKNLRYIRPLLRLSKKDLESFNARHHIPWGLDESNLSDAYLRNQIRHTQVETMSKSEKMRWIKEMKQENGALQIRRKQAEFKRNHLLESEWLNDSDAPFILETWFHEKTGLHLSASHARTLCAQLQKNVQIPYREWSIERWNDHLLLIRESALAQREISIPSMDALQSMMEQPVTQGICTWRIASAGRTIESVTVSEADFPLKLCTIEPGDSIALRYGTKKAARIFIDQKWSHTRRKSVLILKNKENRVIFIPGTGCDTVHFSPNPSFYMIES